MVIPKPASKKLIIPSIELSTVLLYWTMPLELSQHILHFSFISETQHSSLFWLMSLATTLNMIWAFYNQV
ncbi:hypothetical protein SAMN05660293_03671 [Dyadobacter psychrophilus]|uniref:Uncharacterized protein n=1 Tax=Dyadobacter psychrophilus TaxID=651661 RepID=A0A1T5G541_9BACT|nr:hypothetical protein SAMN05660293_03671 [Dyadobacter psychrophilus]